MTDSHFTFTDRARPICEIGVGDSRIDESVAVWDTAVWDGDFSQWAGTEPLWFDVSCDVVRAECIYGRSSTTDRFVPGTATVLVDNRSGWADPGKVDAPGILSLRPGRSIRFGVEHITLGRRWLFRGFIDALRPTYQPNGIDAVEIHCLDALGEVNRAKWTPYVEARGAGETANIRVARILDRAGWPQSKRSIAMSSTTMIETRLDAQAADLLGIVAESVGGAIYGDTEGRVVFKNRDWQSFPSDAPVDGQIGNVDPGYLIPGTSQIDGYLTPTVGYASTPDAPELHMTGAWRITAGVRLDALPVSGYGTVAAQRLTTASDLAWHTGVNPTQFVTRRSSDGTSFPGALNVFATMPPIGVDTTVTMDIPAATLWNSTAALAIGVRAASGTSADVWLGRIYWVQAETLDGDGNVTSLVWRFDANDFTGSGVSYTDPRGRTWTLSTASAITPMIPEVAPEWVTRDVCPTGWTRPFDRADLSTRVILGRGDEGATVPLELDDNIGISMFGVEPFERLYLVTEQDADLLTLAQRILEVRKWSTLPRVRSVDFDAATSNDALDLMTTVDIYDPSRYRCRLLLDRGLIFDEEMLATAVFFEIEPSLWRLNLSLDLARPYAVADTRWDTAGWDLDPWTIAV